MRFSKHRKGSRRTEITLNLASMIDVTFLLLIYFMVSMISVMEEDSLNPALQTMRTEGAGAMNDFQPQRLEVLSLDGRPVFRIGSRIMTDRASLVEMLRTLPKSLGVVVEVHEGVSVGFAVSALQGARDAGFEQVTYVPSA